MNIDHTAEAAKITPAPKDTETKMNSAIINLVIPGANRNAEDARFDDIINSIGINEDEIELNIRTRRVRCAVSSCCVYTDRIGNETESAALTETVRAHYPNAIW
jgi:hypothetical protein